ncbi:hypothetical protein ISN45_At03g005960 [Arabidopsis thaliana x Arabidopsis arenosa]|uniref:Uncharacterized protein n=1 Tax=Arabidopsis thaliana x Arabidopsis arenosa TaxID=1240361 RepID=A0A8T2EJR9_9BRAS|nr:hypothetical protein ISN45_At03g005960 [Arabidopsis thaliana x Arabidopsis arenosa]
MTQLSELINGLSKWERIRGKVIILPAIKAPHWILLPFSNEKNQNKYTHY